jgi:phosphate/sulfate permease
MKKWIKDGLISAVFGVIIVVFLFSLFGFPFQISSIIIGGLVGGLGISYLHRKK